MPNRKVRKPVGVAAEEKFVSAKLPRTLRRAARGTLLAAGLTMAQWSVDVAAMETKLFSPEAVDRLKAPITRFRD